MSRKERLGRFRIGNSLSMIGTAQNISSIADLGYVDNIGIQLIWTGSPVGSWAFQTSVDYDPTTANLGTWSSLTFTYWNGSAWVTATSIPTSLGSPIFVEMNVTSIPNLRLLYTNVSGTGSYNAYLTGKGM